MKTKIISISLGVAVLFTAFLLLQSGCTEDTQDKGGKKVVEPERPQVNVPVFNADSAYFLVEKQVAFGPRVPGSAAHKECGDYMVQKLEEYGATVIEQEGTVEAFDGSELPMRNIIGQFQPEKENRLLLFAHWDTRPFADKDEDRINEPIDGADDGGLAELVVLAIHRQGGLACQDRVTGCHFDCGVRSDRWWSERGKRCDARSDARISLHCACLT